MSVNGRRVLVTGAGGFIGSHLAEELVRRGARVTAMVHYNALGSRGWLDASELAGDMEVVAGDICDRDCARKSMEGAEIVFHLAALIAIPYSYRAPDSYVRTNIGGTLNVLQTARDMGGVRVVHTSTSEVYGTARYVPIDEAHPLQGQSPYSASKIGADKMAEAFHLSYGVPVVTVRPFNTFGPRQSARAVLPTIITQCLDGSEIRLGSLHPTRDWNFVANTADGFIKAGESEGAVGRTINLGSGQEIRVGDAVDLIGKIVGRPVRVIQEQERLRPEKSEVERLLASNKLAEEILGWRPSVGFEEGLRRTVDWFRENRQRYKTDGFVV